ncbi:MAG: hypothetical protein QOE85_466 [Actinomycetota bacterium]|jgi:hypothetical protein|nr:hypothetical protein [Actinomycetota bacterium]MDQ1574405.1 hypothetical protein [Actinomycetota bacterium]
MNISNVADILIAAALVCWIIYRQFTWQLTNASKLWRMPLVVGIIGVIMLSQTKSLTSVRPLDLVILAGELVISIVLGAVMGSLARFRSRPQTANDVRGRRGEPTQHDPSVIVVESRTGALGASLWIVLIALRVGIELAVAHYYPSALLASTGTVLLVVAANRAARAFVVLNRMERKPLVAA